MGVWIRAISAAVVLILLAACGGGSSGGAGTATTQLYLWTGTFDTDVAGGPTKIPVYGGIVPGGHALFFDDAGNVYTFPKYTGDGAFAGQIIEIAPPGGTVDTFGDINLTFTISGAVVTNTSIIGDWTGDFGSAGGFSFKRLGISVGTATITPGVWNGIFLHHSIATRLTVGTDGAFTGTDDYGCALSGKFTQPNPADDLFDVTLHSAGTSFCNANMTGLAFETNTDIDGEIDGGTGVYYYLFVANATSSRMIGFKVR